MLQAYPTPNTYCDVNPNLETYCNLLQAYRHHAPDVLLPVAQQ
jgi:hypothetical protein